MVHRYKIVFISVLAISSIIIFSYLRLSNEDGTAISSTKNEQINTILYRHEFTEKKNDLTLNTVVSHPRGIKNSSHKKRELITISEGLSSSNTNLKMSQNIVAIAVASTTRKIKKPSVKNMALFTMLIPSLLKTIEKDYKYRLYIGYDIGDRWWDVSDKHAIWENFNFTVHLAQKSGISLSIHLVRCNNPQKKPGPVFNCMLKKAYDEGAHFFARLNDDSEFLNPWTTIFRDFVLSRGPPYGVAGPWCNEGKQSILTHDFVHRTHMDIFNGTYYPPILSDWWMDDWITLVYGRNRTKRFRSVRIIHHIHFHNTRYLVDWKHVQFLKGELQKGREKLWSGQKKRI